MPNLNINNLTAAAIGAGEIATNSSVDQKVMSVSDTANLALQTANSKTKTFVQSYQPTSGMSSGDTWIDTANGNSLHTFDGTSWLATQGGGSNTFLQTSAPSTGMAEGDIWVDSDDNYKQYRYNGSAWIPLNYNPIAAINAGVSTSTTTIDGGRITTGTITAGHISTAGLSAGVIKSGVIYNTGGSAANYTMKIDLDNGEIHIK